MLIKGVNESESMAKSVAKSSLVFSLNLIKGKFGGRRLGLLISVNSQTY
jgi:hypothetical protein